MDNNNNNQELSKEQLRMINEYKLFLEQYKYFLENSNLFELATVLYQKDNNSQTKYKQSMEEQMKFDINEKEDTKIEKPKKRRTEKDTEDLDGEDYILTIPQAHESFSLKKEDYIGKTISIVPSEKYVKKWEWGKMNNNQEEERKVFCKNNFVEILDDFKDLHLASAMRYLIIGEHAHEKIEEYKRNNKKKKESNNSNKVNKEEELKEKLEEERKFLAFLRKEIPLQTDCVGLETYKRWAHWYEIVLECPPILFLLMEKKHIHVQVSPSIIWKKYASIMKFINSMKLANKKDWSKIMGLCVDIPLKVFHSLPFPIKDVIREHTKDVEGFSSDSNNTNNNQSNNNNNNNNKNNNRNQSNNQITKRLETLTLNKNSSQPINNNINPEQLMNQLDNINRNYFGNQENNNEIGEDLNQLPPDDSYMEDEDVNTSEAHRFADNLPDEEEEEDPSEETIERMKLLKIPIKKPLPKNPTKKNN